MPYLKNNSQSDNDEIDFDTESFSIQCNDLYNQLNSCLETFPSPDLNQTVNMNQTAFLSAKIDHDDDSDDDDNDDDDDDLVEEWLCSTIPILISCCATTSQSVSQIFNEIKDTKPKKSHTNLLIILSSRVLEPFSKCIDLVIQLEKETKSLRLDNESFWKPFGKIVAFCHQFVFFKSFREAEKTTWSLLGNMVGKQIFEQEIHFAMDFANLISEILSSKFFDENRSENPSNVLAKGFLFSVKQGNGELVENMLEAVFKTLSQLNFQHDLTFAKSIENFICTTVDFIPKEMILSLPILFSMLNDPVYRIRTSIVHCIQVILEKVPKTEMKPGLDVVLYDALFARVYDVTAFARVKVLHAFEPLIKMMTKEQLEKLFLIVIERVSDISTHVRRAAIHCVTCICEKHPFLEEDSIRTGIYTQLQTSLYPKIESLLKGGKLIDILECLGFLQVVCLYGFPKSLMFIKKMIKLLASRPDEKVCQTIIGIFSKLYFQIPVSILESGPVCDWKIPDKSSPASQIVQLEIDSNSSTQKRNFYIAICLAELVNELDIGHQQAFCDLLHHFGKQGLIENTLSRLVFLIGCGFSNSPESMQQACLVMAQPFVDQLESSLVLEIIFANLSSQNQRFTPRFLMIISLIVAKSHDNKSLSLEASRSAAYVAICKHIVISTDSANWIPVTQWALRCIFQLSNTPLQAIECIVVLLAQYTQSFMKQIQNESEILEQPIALESLVRFSHIVGNSIYEILVIDKDVDQLISKIWDFSKIIASVAESIVPQLHQKEFPPRFLNAIILGMGKCMYYSKSMTRQYVELLFKFLTPQVAVRYPNLSCNTVLLVADLIQKWPNIVTPYMDQLIQILESKDIGFQLKKCVSMALVHLICNSILKFRQFIPIFTLLAHDENQILSNLARYCFKETGVEFVDETKIEQDEDAETNNTFDSEASTSHVQNEIVQVASTLDTLSVTSA